MQTLVAGNQPGHIENDSVQGYGGGLSMNDTDMQRMNLLSSPFLPQLDGACLCPPPTHVIQCLTACSLASSTLATLLVNQLDLEIVKP